MLQPALPRKLPGIRLLALDQSRDIVTFTQAGPFIYEDLLQLTILHR